MLTPEIANEIVEKCPDAAALFKRDGSGHRKYGYRHRLLKPTRREISITTQGTKDGITLYINKRSCSGETFPTPFPERFFAGVSVTKEYPRGSAGATGDRGLSSVAASCPTLDPRDNDVMRLSCSDSEGFRRLLDWYAGNVVLAAAQPQGVPSGQIAAMSAVPMADAHPQVPVSSAASPESPLAVSGSEVPSADDAASITEEEEIRLMSDPRRRHAVERRAVELAILAYREQGFVVEELGKPFDLLCTPPSRCPPGARVVHVEVKGSVGTASNVHLTRNEVSDARAVDKSWRSDLFIVGNIGLTDVAGTIVASGGTQRCLEDWVPEDRDLAPTDFVYRVPAESTGAGAAPLLPIFEAALPQ